MGDILKQLYTTKSLSLGWSLFWRSFLVMIVHAIVLTIIGMLLQNSIIGIISFIAFFIINLIAMGWAVQRVKDKL